MKQKGKSSQILTCPAGDERQAVSDATPTELQRLLAREFEARGWRYNLTVVRSLVQEAQRSATIDVPTLSRKVPATYLEENRARREDMTDAISRAIGGRNPVSEPAVTSVVINDQRYSLNLSGGSTISGGNVNVGGTQLVVETSTAKEDVLAAVAALLRSGLAGDWSADAAAELGRAIDEREDILFEDIEVLAREVAEAETADPRRIRNLLSQIATNAVGGALGTGMAAGLGQALAHLPGLF